MTAGRMQCAKKPLQCYFTTKGRRGESERGHSILGRPENRYNCDAPKRDETMLHRENWKTLFIFCLPQSGKGTFYSRKDVEKETGLNFDALLSLFLFFFYTKPVPKPDFFSSEKDPLQRLLLQGALCWWKRSMIRQHVFNSFLEGLQKV